MKAVIAAGGRLEVVDREIPSPGEGEVLVKVFTTALNRMDLLQAAGKYPVPAGVTEVLGVELAGEVTAVGPGVAGVEIGTRGMALVSGGSYAEYCLVDAEMLMPIPEGFSMQQAAAVPETWLTAFQLLHLVGGPLEAGEGVVIHAAGSGVGTAAIQLAKGAGARVYATAGSAAKLDNAKALGADGAFNYKDEAGWGTGVVAAAADTGGVQLVLDCVGGSYVEQTLDALSMDGRWVLYGLMGGPGIPASVTPAFLGRLLRKRVQVRATTLRSRSKAYKAELARRFLAHAGPRLASGAYRPVVDAKSFASLDEAQAAHDYMASNANTGKILLHVAPDKVEAKSEL